MIEEKWDSGFEDELEAEEYYMDRFGIEDDSDFEPMQKNRSNTAEQKFHSEKRADRTLRELKRTTRSL